MKRCWLHRKGGITWEFTTSKRYGTLVHVTRYGTVYGIMSSLKAGKPFWIGELRDINGKPAWGTVEKELRAEAIEFENGGRYLFPIGK